MKYLSVCSGIEAASVAWHPLGWQPVAFSEIEKFPCFVLAHHYPNVPNWGDMTKFKEWPNADVDVLVGGTPCQSFSVAGLRKGLDDPRGNLMLTYLAIAAKYRPQWLVWENVPGVLSSNGGRDFASLLRGMGQLGYGFAYRILDAQYFGVAQRRRRVFVVGHLGNWQRAAAVLFERHSLSGHPAPRREAGKRVAKTVTASLGTGGPDYETKELIGEFDYENLPAITQAHHQVAFGEYVNDDTSSAMKQRDYKDATDLVTHSLRAEGFDASEDGTGRGTPLVPVAFHPTQDPISSTDGSTHALGCGSTNGTASIAVAFEPGIMSREGGHVYEEISGTLRKEPGDNQMTVMQAMQVRRLTPKECCRLQGFPDD